MDGGRVVIGRSGVGTRHPSDVDLGKEDPERDHLYDPRFWGGYIPITGLERDNYIWPEIQRWSMRGLPIFSSYIIILILVALQFSVASPMPAPVVTITVTPMHQEVNASATTSTFVNFEVNVQVNKMPRQQVTVTLNASVDINWVCTLDPAKIVFSSLSMNPSQGSNCCITVPARMSGVYVNLAVTGVSASNGISSTTTSAASFYVNPFPPGPVNQSGNNTNASARSSLTNGTLAQATGNASSSLFGMDKGTVLIVAAACIIILGSVSAAYAIVRMKRRKNRYVVDAMAGG